MHLISKKRHKNFKVRNCWSNTIGAHLQSALLFLCYLRPYCLPLPVRGAVLPQASGALSARKGTRKSPEGDSSAPALVLPLSPTACSANCRRFPLRGPSCRMVVHCCDHRSLRELPTATDFATPSPRIWSKVCAHSYSLHFSLSLGYRCAKTQILLFSIQSEGLVCNLA